MVREKYRSWNQVRCKLLRDNGINTTYSCHHAMVIEAENYEIEEIRTIYDLLIENKYDSFIIEMVFVKEQGQMLRRHLRIKFVEGEDG